MDVQTGQPKRNLDMAEAWIEEASRRGSDLVVFPELWDTGFDPDHAPALASAVNAGQFARVAELARVHRIHVVGSMLERVITNGENHCFNTATWFTPEGTIAGVYRKIHLFRQMDEDRFVQAGDELPVFDLPWGKTGTAICYDLRFPELFRRYVLAGVQLIVVPAQWPITRVAHWETLLKARAIENQVFVIACNRVGKEGKVKFAGHSAIFDPWGEAVISAGEEAVLLTAALDMNEVEQVRQKLTVFEDRRPDIYDR
ncbi:MAG: carbon-nitrogen family hydrolase [Anaerolineae bacterium]|nr:carbon-nitrogen family hydrolase [Anaerolineae bacterium]